MLLRFVAGRAGSGKSTWVYESVKRDMRESSLPVYVVVPEQYTLQTEKELLAALGAKGFLQARVSSPTRLADEVFSQVEQSRKTAVGESGLAMAFSASASRIAGELRAFGSVLAFRGFSLGMVRLIAEMKRYDISPERLLTASEGARGALKAKAEDIASLYKEYDAFLASRNFIDNEDRFNFFIAGIRKASFLRGCSFYFDGFDTLSPQHCRMVGELLAVSSSVSVTLDYDGFENSDSGLFRAAEANVARLSAIAGELGAEVKWTHLRAGERAKAMPPDIAHLERSLFTWPADIKETEGGVTLCRATSIEEEAEAAACWISGNMRRGGLRWREIAVQCGDQSAYGPVVGRVFARYGIPAFIDSRKAISGHPAVRFILSLIRVVERDFRTDDALRLVKTGLAGVPADAVDRLEVWLTEFAPRGARAWSRDWEKGRDIYDLADLNRSRKAVYGLTEALFSHTGGKSAPANRWASALYAVLSQMKLDERLDADAAILKREGLLEEAAVTERVWNAVIGLLDQLHEIIGDEPLDAAGFRSILQSGFESVEEGILPTGVDQVLVGSIGRSKYSGLKHMMILGAQEGLSYGSSGSGVLTGRDVDSLASLGVELGRGSDLRASQRRFALYQAVAKGSAGLYVSWTAETGNGGEGRPDRFVQSVMDLLRIGEDGIVEASSLIGQPAPACGGLGRFAGRLGKAAEGNAAEDLPAELKWYLSSPEYKGRVIDIIRGISGETPAEYLKAAGAALGGVTNVSASQLESYWNCPFRHFTEYVLAPQSWREHGVEGPDAGQFLHAAMERFGRRLLVMQTGAPAEEAEAAAMMEREASGLSEEFRYGLLKGSARLDWTGRNLQRIAMIAAATYIRQMRNGEFRPFGQELRFGRGGIPAAPIPLPDGSFCFLQGRIDRLDVARMEDADYLRVIDYKSGSASIDVYDAVNGLDMQTWLYLVALEGLWVKIGKRPARPAGAYIFPLADPWVEDGADEEKERRKALRLNGWCVKDSQVIRAMDGEAANGRSQLFNFGSRAGLHEEAIVSSALSMITRNAGESVARLRRGHVAAKPWRSGRDTACAACPWGALCRFGVRDTKEYRKLLSKEEIDSLLGAKGEGGGDGMDG